MRFKIDNAITRIHFAVSISVRPMHISRGFVDSGHATNEAGEYDLEKMLQLKRGDVVYTEVLTYLLQRAKDVDIPLMKQQARLTEEQLNASNKIFLIKRAGQPNFEVEALPDLEDSVVPRDMQPLFKQRAVCLTATSSVTAYRAEQGMGTEFTGNRADAAAIKRFAHNISVKRARDTEKEKEKVAFNALSEEERKQFTDKQNELKRAKKDKAAALKAAAMSLLAAKDLS